MNSLHSGANIEPEMIVIPAGAYVMGCDTGPKNEAPAHRIFVDEFAIARVATTNRLYQLFIEDTGYQPAGRKVPRLNHHDELPGRKVLRFDHPDQPVTCVSWLDASAYCEWL